MALESASSAPSGSLREQLASLRIDRDRVVISRPKPATRSGRKAVPTNGTISTSSSPGSPLDSRLVIDEARVAMIREAVEQLRLDRPSSFRPRSRRPSQPPLSGPSAYSPANWSSSSSSPSLASPAAESDRNGRDVIPPKPPWERDTVQPAPRPATRSAPRPRRRRSWGFQLLSLMLWMIPLAILAALASQAYRYYDARLPKFEVTVAVAQKMTQAEAQKILSAKGYIKARRQTMVGAMSPGRIERILVSEGMKVSEGELLAVLEHNELDALLKSREAMIEQKKAELKEAETALEDRRRKEERLRALSARRSVPIEEFEDAVYQTRMAASRVEALKAAIRLMEASAQETRETIRNMEIRAPFTGTILTKDAEVGETLTPGGMGAASGRGSVVNLADLTDLEVETDVAESLLARLQPGQPAEVSVAAVPNRRYQGRLRQIIQLGDRARGTIKVKVELLDEDERLFPELAATVNFLPIPPDFDPNDPVASFERAGIQAAAEPEVFVPRAAVFDENGEPRVWVVDENSRVNKVALQVAPAPNAPTQWKVEQGLQGGERVVLNPPAELRPGMLVKLPE